MQYKEISCKKHTWLKKLIKSQPKQGTSQAHHGYICALGKEEKMMGNATKEEERWLAGHAHVHEERKEAKDWACVELSAEARPLGTGARVKKIEEKGRAPQLNVESKKGGVDQMSACRAA